MIAWLRSIRVAFTVNLDRPRLRPGLTPVPDPGQARCVILWDQLHLSEHQLRLSHLELEFVKLFNGQRTLGDMQTEVMRQLGGQFVPLELFQNLHRLLDEALFLEGPRFRARLESPLREPSCLGVYEADPERLRRQLEGLFRAGPGLPTPCQPTQQLRAALLPHIDYQRGGVSFAWGFKEVVEQTDAALFVIIGTSHYSGERFTLTRKDFKTPLGIVPTDQGYIDKLVAHYGSGLFDDPLAHLPEHSIELEVVILQYLYERRRPIRIVPLVVGSFHDCVRAGTSPRAANDIARMVTALRQVEAETAEPICYLISGDLAHIGPKFGDKTPVAEADLSLSRAQDQALLRQTARADPAGYFQVIAKEGDRRRICGLPPTWTVLAATQPARGRVLHYDQYVHPEGFESVSFASVAFYR